MRAVEADEDWALTQPEGRRARAQDLGPRPVDPHPDGADRDRRALPDLLRPGEPGDAGAPASWRGSRSRPPISAPRSPCRPGRDQHGRDRTAVCCLSSLNLETWFEWKDNPRFIPDVMRFLDNVLQDFIDTAPDGMAKAKYSAMRERSVGLGVMGFHSFLQGLNVPFESVVAKVWNKRMFKHIRDAGRRRQPHPGRGARALPGRRRIRLHGALLNKMAIAPTASISIICRQREPGDRADRGQRLPATRRCPAATSSATPT